MASPISEDSTEVYAALPRNEPTVEAADAPKVIPTEATEFAPKGHIIDDSARGTIFWEADHSDEDEEKEEVKAEGRRGASLSRSSGYLQTVCRSIAHEACAIRGTRIERSRLLVTAPNWNQAWAADCSRCFTGWVSRRPLLRVCQLQCLVEWGWLVCHKCGPSRCTLRGSIRALTVTVTGCCSSIRSSEHAIFDFWKRQLQIEANHCRSLALGL
jgi:hypothetical protein